MVQKNIDLHQIYLTGVRADNLLSRLIQEQLERFDLSIKEWLLMGVVDKSSPSGLTLSQISEMLMVSQPQVTALVIELTTKRLVKLKVYSQDKRVRFAHLTAKGKRTFVQISEGLADSTKQRLADTKLSDLDDFIKSLNDVSDRVKKLQAGENIQVKRGDQVN